MDTLQAQSSRTEPQSTNHGEETRATRVLGFAQWLHAKYEEARSVEGHRTAWSNLNPRKAAGWVTLAEHLLSEETDIGYIRSKTILTQGLWDLAEVALGWRETLTVTVPITMKRTGIKTWHIHRREQPRVENGKLPPSWARTPLVVVSAVRSIAQITKSALNTILGREGQYATYTAPQST